MSARWMGWLIAVVCAAPAAVSAQQPGRRVRVTVDYQAGQNLYISAGTAQGVFAQDTVIAFGESGGTALGRLVIVSSTRSRAVAAYAGTAFPVERGAGLLLEISEAALARLSAAQVLDSTAITPLVINPDNAPRRERITAARGLSVHGRIGLDADATQSRSEWGRNPGEQDQYRFHNQAGRLRLNVDGLPGGARLVTNLRASSYGGLGAAQEGISLRIYQASLEKDFTTVPLRMQLGRFYNPYESHSGYWDGALLRVGNEAVGGGVAAGYEPENGNETFSATRPKLAGFLDLHQRKGTFRYDGDFSWHRDQPQFSTSEREFFGITQRVSWRGAFFTQRAQIGHPAGGAWSLWQAQLTGSVTLTGPLRLNARYATERNDLYDLGVTGTRRERRAVGLSVSNALGYANVEAGTTASGSVTEGQTWYATLGWPRAPLGIGLGFVGSYWTEGGFESLSWSPALERTFGRVHARAAFQHNRTDYASGSFVQRGGELSLAVPLPAATELYVAVRSDWADRMTSQRVLTSIWKSF
jgi:hypothetical protein